MDLPLSENIRKKVHQEFAGFEDWAHGTRHGDHVSQFASQIAQSEGFDPDIALITGLCHDLGRIKEKSLVSVYPPPDPSMSNHAALSVTKTQELLSSYPQLADQIPMIVDAIAAHSDKTLRNPDNKLSQILMDADRGDGWGYWGIIRMAKIRGHFDPPYPENEVDIEPEAKKLIDSILTGHHSLEKTANFVERLKYLEYWFDGDPTTGVQPLNTTSARTLLAPNWQILRHTRLQIEQILPSLA